MKDNQRFLFILSNKTLYLEKYKDKRPVEELNQWLKDNAIDLEFGLNIESKEEQQSFFDWLKKSN